MSDEPLPQDLTAAVERMKHHAAWMTGSISVMDPRPSLSELGDDLKVILASHAELQARAESTDLVYQKSYELGTEWRTRAEAAEARATTAETALAQAREALPEDGGTTASGSPSPLFSAGFAVGYAHARKLLLAALPQPETL